MKRPEDIVECAVGMTVDPRSVLGTVDLTAAETRDHLREVRLEIHPRDGSEFMRDEFVRLHVGVWTTQVRQEAHAARLVDVDELVHIHRRVGSVRVSVTAMNSLHQPMEMLTRFRRVAPHQLRRAFALASGQVS